MGLDETGDDNNDDERYRYPCKLSYCIEHCVEVELTCPDAAGLVYALARFRDDQMRVGFGLMAILATVDSGEVRIGLNADRDAACLGYSSQADVERARPSMGHTQWARGDASPDKPPADFRWF